MKGFTEPGRGKGESFRGFIKSSFKQEKTTWPSTSEKLLAPGVEF